MGCGSAVHAQARPSGETVTEENSSATAPVETQVEAHDTSPGTAPAEMQVENHEGKRRIDRHSLASADSLRQVSHASRRLTFLYEERQTARQDAGFGVATRDHEQPAALWLLGPSAVGKTTQAKLRAKDFGIPNKDGGLDAVVVDGEFFRDAHESYQEWTKTDDWKAAYPALKSRINKEKQDMLQDAKDQKVHLIIPQTCLDLKSCLDEVQQLTEAGYVNHIIAIQAPKEEVARRGMLRAQADGKVYDPSQFERSIAAFNPMIEAANGRLLQLHVKERPGGPRAGFDVTVTSEGWCGKAPLTAIEAARLRETTPSPAQVLVP